MNNQMMNVEMNTQKKESLSVLDILKLNDENRRRQLSEKQRLLDMEKNPAQCLTTFWKSFRELANKVNLGIEEKKERKKRGKEIAPNEIDELVSIVNEMRQLGADSSMFLPSYDIQQTQKMVNTLLDDIEQARIDIAPRKKFSFGARRQQRNQEKKQGNNNDTSNEVKLDQVDEQPNDYLNLLQDDTGCIEYSNKENELIYINEKKMDEKSSDVSLSHLTRCVVVITCPISALRMDDLKDCSVFSGPITGSVLLDHANACTFMVACRQIRIHHTTQSFFYLRMLSTPIIEDCSELKFFKYYLQYPQLIKQLEQSEMMLENDLWSQVNDFKWHRSQHSPNWSILSSDEKIQCVPSLAQGLISFKIEE